MNKEKTDSSTERALTPTQELEKQKFKRLTLRQVLDSVGSEDMELLYNWLEEGVIMGTDNTKLEIKTQNGIESATIKQLDPETKKWVEYYTTDKSEIERLKAARDGEAIKTQAF